jgi:hypothetical protein
MRYGLERKRKNQQQDATAPANGEDREFRIFGKAGTE